MSPAISSQLAFDVTKICALGLSLISVSMAPRRTRTVFGVVVFLLTMGGLFVALFLKTSLEPKTSGTQQDI